MAATTAAVDGLGRALAGELTPIRVNLWAPDFVPDTGVYAAMSERDRKTMTLQVALGCLRGGLAHPPTSHRQRSP